MFKISPGKFPHNAAPRLGRVALVLVKVGNRLGLFCEWLSDVLYEVRHRLDRCENCGRLRWYGRGCKYDESPSKYTEEM